MNEDEKLNKIEEEQEIEEEEEEFSLYDDIVLQQRQHTSNESLKNDEKKKKKFKPGKFISKHLKIKKTKKEEKNFDSTGETNSETRSEDSSTKSPKPGIFRRFSRKKKYQVSPFENDGNALNNERDLKDIEKLPKVDVSISNNLSELDVNEEPLIQTINKEESSVTERKSSLTEDNKKIQLQITISGKKIEKLQTNNVNESQSTEATVSETAIDKVSSPLQYSNNNTSQNDIMLPSERTPNKVNKIREEFFNTILSQNNNSENTKIQQHTKSISHDTLPQSVSNSTIKQTNSDGYKTENATVSTSEKEIEKYSLITSSLNSIISSAKDLEDSNKVEFQQNAPVLRIYEDTDLVKTASKTIEYQKTVELIKLTEKFEESTSKNQEDETKSVTIVSSENQEKVQESTEETQEIQIKIKAPEITKPEEQIVQGKIKENSEDQILTEGDMKKSKIPINKRKSLSDSSSNEKESSQSTVRTQEAHKPYHLNLSISSSTDDLKSTKEEINFEVGTAVRPPKILTASSNTGNITPIVITGIENDSANIQKSIDDVFHSPKSDSNLSIEKRDSKTRRKIAYIPQLTIYTPEEQELLKSNIIANYESFDTPSLPLDSSMFPVFDDSMVSSMTPLTPEKRECLYKILVIGELGTGKTSFIKRYVHQFFSQNYRATIGVDFALKVLNWDQSTIIRLQLWDIAGQERFGNMTRVYYKEAVGAFIVFDVTRPATFDAVNKWKTDLDSKVQLPDGSPIPCILLANKCDQPKQGLVTMPTKLDEYCKQNGFAGWYETSAKENTNIDESAKALVSKILLNDKLIHNDMVDGERLILNAEDINKPKKFCSC